MQDLYNHLIDLLLSSRNQKPPSGLPQLPTGLRKTGAGDNSYTQLPRGSNLPNRYLKQGGFSPIGNMTPNRHPMDNAVYDWQAFFNSGDKGAIDPHDGTYHVTDIGKRPEMWYSDEPFNFSNESIYANPQYAPRWDSNADYSNPAILRDPLTQQIVRAVGM